MDRWIYEGIVLGFFFAIVKFLHFFYLFIVILFSKRIDGRTDFR